MSNIDGFNAAGAARPVYAAPYLPPAALAGVRTRRIFAGRAGLKNFHDLPARVMGLSFDDPHPHPVTFGREGHKDHESLLNAGEAVSTKDYFLDRDLDRFPA